VEQLGASLFEEMYIKHLIFFILYIVNSQFATLDQQNAQYFSLEFHIGISHSIFLQVSIDKGSSSGNQTRMVPHKTKLGTFVHSLHDVEGSDN
jgi:dolichyl-phosphate-mannose--protein O-mannosyl transferase